MSGVTEDAVNDLIASFLRHEGIDTLTQITVNLPEGWAKADLRIKNKGTFYGEGEWKGRGWQGFAQARDYLRAADATGSFVIEYPTRLKKDLKIGKTTKPSFSMYESVLSKYRYRVAFLTGPTTDMATLSLDDLPQWIKANIELKKAFVPDLDWTVSILRQTAESLTNELRDVHGPDLFRSILGSKTGTENQVEVARKASGYLLVNQITFYRVLSEIKNLPEIDPDKLKSPQDLDKYFSKVLDINYTPVFSHPIASKFSRKSMTLLRNAVKTIFALSLERIGHEALGKVFHELIPLPIRKSIAAYYTKDKAGKILAELSINKPNAKVMDPACGSGTLLAHSYRRKKSLSDKFEVEDHRRFVEEDITGIDIVPFAAHLSTINLSLQSPEYPTDLVRIGIEDSTKLELGKSISPMSRILPKDKRQRQLEDWMSRPGAIATDTHPGKEIEFTEVDNIIMNPPFTRQETISVFSKEYKSELEKRFQEADEKGILNRKMSYCSYFILLADKFLKDKGRTSIVLPASILRKKYDEELRRYLLNKYDFEYVIAREDKPNFSEDTNFREILLILKKGKSPKNKVNFIILRDYEKLYLSHLKEVSRSLYSDLIKNTNFELRRFNQDNLEARNVFRPISTTDYSLVKLWDSIRSNIMLTKVGNLDVEIREGARSRKGGKYPEMSISNSKKFCKKKRDCWVFDKREGNKIIAKNRHTGDFVKVPTEALYYNLRRISGRRKIDVSDLEEFVVKEDFQNSDLFFSLSGIEKTEFNEKWKSYLENRISNINIVRRVDFSAPGTSLFSYFSEIPRVHPNMTWSMITKNEVEAKQLCLWINSTLNLLQLLIERTPSRGAWVEIGKFNIEEMVAINRKKIGENEKRSLLEAFEEIKDVEFPSLWKQLAMNCEKADFSREEIKEMDDFFNEFKSCLGKPFEPRRKMDEAIFSVLGVKNKEKILRKLYPGLMREIFVLKRMMK